MSEVSEPKLSISISSSSSSSSSEEESSISFNVLSRSSLSSSSLSSSSSLDSIKTLPNLLKLGTASSRRSSGLSNNDMILFAAIERDMPRKCVFILFTLHVTTLHPVPVDSTVVLTFGISSEVMSNLSLPFIPLKTFVTLNLSPIAW